MFQASETRWLQNSKSAGKLISFNPNSVFLTGLSGLFTFHLFPSLLCALYAFLIHSLSTLLLLNYNNIFSNAA